MMLYFSTPWRSLILKYIYIILRTAVDEITLLNTKGGHTSDFLE